jgi:hypothetical protein
MNAGARTILSQMIYPSMNFAVLHGVESIGTMPLTAAALESEAYNQARFGDRLIYINFLRALAARRE